MNINVFGEAMIIGINDKDGSDLYLSEEKLENTPQNAGKNEPAFNSL